MNDAKIVTNETMFLGNVFCGNIIGLPHEIGDILLE